MAIVAIVLITIAGARNGETTAYAAETNAEDNYNDGIVDIITYASSTQETGSRSLYFANTAYSGNTVMNVRAGIKYQNQAATANKINIAYITNNTEYVQIFVSSSESINDQVYNEHIPTNTSGLTEVTIDLTGLGQGVQYYIMFQFASFSVPTPANTWWIDIVKLQVIDVDRQMNLVNVESYQYDYLKQTFENANSSGYENGYNDGYTEGKEQILNNNFDFGTNGTPSKKWDTYEYQIDQPPTNPSTGERPKGFIEDWNFGGTHNITAGSVKESQATYNSASPYLTITIGEVKPTNTNVNSWSSAVLYTDTITINDTIDNLNFILTYQTENNPPENIQFFYFNSNNYTDFYNTFTNKNYSPQVENLPEYCTIFSPTYTTTGNDQIAEAKITSINQGGYIFGVLFKNTNTGGNREETNINIKNFSITTLTSDNINSFYQQGYESGYNTGLNDGKEQGYDSGYAEGEQAGLITGYDKGYNAGVADGNGLVSTISSLLTTVQAGLNVDLIGSISIGDLLNVALGILLTFAIIRFFGGG